MMMTTAVMIKMLTKMAIMITLTVTFVKRVSEVLDFSKLLSTLWVWLFMVS